MPDTPNAGAQAAPTKQDAERAALRTAGIVPIRFESGGLLCAGSDDPEALEPLCMRCHRYTTAPEQHALIQPAARYIKALREWRCVEFHGRECAPASVSVESLGRGGVVASSSADWGLAA